ncbi:glycosyltransferase family 4 protein [Actinoplanes sp. NPDC048967]|uniref:glycosyltransferase family 4 protein n=1 Tax=Actinoplanes sp. NPDC048967 TaxID=3155269 RepID=UPI003408C90E
MSRRTVVYLALGSRRINAALRLSAQAAAGGAAVTLVVLDGPAWSAVEPPPGVELRRLPDRRAVAALLAGRALPAGAAVVAGDVPALVAAWSVGRRRRDVTVTVEPDAERGRRPQPADLAVVTPWYPGPNDDFAGAFVRATTDAVRSGVGTVSTLHSEGWFYPRAEASPDAVDAVTDRLAARAGLVVVRDTPQGELCRVAVPSLTTGGYPQWIDAHVRAVRAALPTGRIEAPVVHAHTGLYGGAVAAALARPEARVVVTEHATFLPRVLGKAGVRSRYAAMLNRADVVLCVGGSLRDYLGAEFPQHAAKFQVVPNPIDFAGFAVRPEPVTELKRWLYVGRLIEHKGVRVLLEAFAIAAAADPSRTLTMVGSGPLTEELGRRAAELGLADRVRLLAPVRPDQVAALMHDHDLLVHLSSKETFGMTVVEAVATGLPVLVAASDGPRETMAGLSGVAGRLVEVDCPPERVAEAFEELVKELPQLDLVAAREALRERYGTTAVAAQLQRWYQEPITAVTEPAFTPGDRIVVLVTDATAAARVRAALPRAVAAGAQVDVLTTVDGITEGAGVTVHRLRAGAGLERIRHAEDVVVRKAPGKVVDGLLNVARRRPEPGWEVLLRRARRLHRRGARKAEAVLIGPRWARKRSDALWSELRGELLPGLDLARTRYVVAAGPVARELAGRLVAGHPGVVVTGSLDQVPGSGTGPGK